MCTEGICGMWMLGFEFWMSSWDFLVVGTIWFQSIVSNIKVGISSRFWETSKSNLGAKVEVFSSKSLGISETKIKIRFWFGVHI